MTQASTLSEDAADTTTPQANRVGATLAVAPTPLAQPTASQNTRIGRPLNQYDAVRFAQILLGTLPGYYKVGAAVTTNTLWLRFHFPAVAERRYADVFRQLEAQTGWQVRLYPGIHQAALLEVARRLLPAGLSIVGKASLHQDRSLLHLRCSGQSCTEAVERVQEQFAEETGWEMEIEME